MTERILVSACLLGQPVRYDGKGKPLLDPRIGKWRDEGRLVPFCPEVAAGMSIPRLPAEIANGRTGLDVMAGRGRVVDSDGADVTADFMIAAELALKTAREHGCRHALLIDGSPSCGSLSIYDGSFSGGRHAGSGVTATMLMQAGIKVYAPRDIDALALALSGEARGVSSSGS